MTLVDRMQKDIVFSRGCWLWSGKRLPTGYGVFVRHKKQRYAHRAMFELTVRALEPGEYVLHRCDNPSCVKPQHLYAGTHRDNMRDMAVRGRSTKGRCPHRILRGEEHPGAKLTEADVRAIKQAFTGKRGELASLGRKYGVNYATVRTIVRGEHWGWVA